MSQQLLRRVDTSVVISGLVFPVLEWSASLANQGSMGTARARGAYSDLVNSGLDIIAASQGVNGSEFDIYVGYDGDLKRVFSGVVDDCDLDVDDNWFEIVGRDHSASLADGKQTLAGKQYRNQSVAQIVKQIADQFGFASDITDPGIQAGPLMNDETSFNPQPQSYWHLLQSLAESVGYECFMRPDQTLYFGPEKEGNSVNVSYGAKQGSGAENPCWGLKIGYKPRNNSNIIVKALSVNPQTTQRVTARAQANQVKVGKGRKTQSSMVGSNAKVSYPGRGSSGNKTPNKSIYYIRCPGMTPDQAQARCQAMADQLAKRQIMVALHVDGLPEMQIHSQVKIIEGQIDLYGFAGIDLNVAEVTHSYVTPGDGASEEGFVTSIRALTQVDNG